MEAKKVMSIIGLICLAFFGIPVRIKKTELTEDELSFQNYVKRYNKSYVNNITEFKIRFENFKVSYVTFFLLLDINKNLIIMRITGKFKTDRGA